jgi:hypothetical protein
MILGKQCGLAFLWRRSVSAGDARRSQSAATNCIGALCWPGTVFVGAVCERRARFSFGGHRPPLQGERIRFPPAVADRRYNGLVCPAASQ